MATQAVASEIVVVGVIGTGQMGSGIAQLVVASGYDVVLLDSDPTALSCAVASISSSLSRPVTKSQATTRRHRSHRPRPTLPPLSSLRV
ncbi:hypothetical protein GUJ93_ZPchr0006g45177 [Zizania palustris]|uniref:3-hydroxyacyl-CoA dehydrogenase NAD binding domain-containing protein n=1 Tax=Zizania palustris TaxID=103762 RepID=A0A8J5TC37_ZIZPA|nr:hypothetical protein GUJ93_ZPchr0006g45177 [Zizania palustris]